MIRLSSNTGNNDSQADVIQMKYIGTQYASKFHLCECSTISGKLIIQEWNSYSEAIQERAFCKVCKQNQ